MITIRLLGGAKKAVGKPAVNLDRQSASVAEILQFLTSISTDARLLQPNNLIVAVNGVDSTALQGQNTVAKSDDTVTIVTVVHGGTDYMIDGNNHVSIIGVRKIAEDAGKLVDRLRAEHPGVSIQAVNVDTVYGVDHLLGILRITLEAEKRKVMLANRRETELLLRLACTDQISDALKKAGLKNGTAGCFIAISEDVEKLLQFSDSINNMFEFDDSVLEPSKQKRDLLASILGLEAKFDDDYEFLQYLLERAAILVK
jgi:tRNA threonylcarbamoyladenosine modification (KEOPS) complex Cgi121 subunit/molybdopterin converting factor small subunit